MRGSRSFRALVFIGIWGQLPAQDPPEKERVLCDSTDPQNGRPGADCICAPDTIEVTFDGQTDSVFEYDTFQDGMTIDVTMVTETVSEKVQGWSYGVAHDPEALEIIEATTNLGTDKFCIDPPCDGISLAPGGWISGVVLSFKKEIEIRRNWIAWAKYALSKDVGPEGALIRFSDQLGLPDIAPVDLNLTINYRSKRWSTAVDGWVKKKGEAPAFRRGDAESSGDVDILDMILNLRSLFGGWKLHADCDEALDSDDDGKLTILDTIFTLAYVFQHGPAFPAPFPGCGPDPTPDAVTCLESSCLKP